jgi:two-component system, chemotaxis family, protein-glutamate methylesterase/glutaminase
VCRVGHSFSAEGLYSEQADALESALWTAVRVLQERSDLATRLADRLDSKGSGLASRRFRANAEDARRHADALQGLVEEFNSSADLGPDEVDVAAAAKGPTRA